MTLTSSCFRLRGRVMEAPSGRWAVALHHVGEIDFTDRKGTTMGCQRPAELASLPVDPRSQGNRFDSNHDRYRLPTWTGQSRLRVAGTEILRSVTRTVQVTCRVGGSATRYGNEELAVPLNA